MRDELKAGYDDGKDIFGYPQKYKEIDFYPIMLKDLHYQDLFYKIFARPKNYIPSVEILKASYLKYIIFVLSNLYQTEENAKLKIIELLSYITRIDNKLFKIIYLDTGLDGWDGIKIQIKIGEIILSEYDFDNIREIVLQQNNLSIEYIEEYNPELEPILEYTNRATSDLTLADQIFTICAIQKIDIKSIENYTLFQFNNLMEKVLTLKEYDLYKPLLVSGRITLKNGGDVKNYFYHSKKSGRYDSISTTVDDFTSQNKNVFDES